MSPDRSDLLISRDTEEMISALALTDLLNPVLREHLRADGWSV